MLSALRFGHWRMRKLNSVSPIQPVVIKEIMKKYLLLVHLVYCIELDLFLFASN